MENGIQHGSCLNMMKLHTRLAEVANCELMNKPHFTNKKFSYFFKKKNLPSKYSSIIFVCRENCNLHKVLDFQHLALDSSTVFSLCKCPTRDGSTSGNATGVSRLDMNPEVLLA